MLDYSDQLLELSSTQKLVKISEYRVLDTRLWNHYLQDWGSSPTTLRECDPSSRKQPTLPKPAASLPQPQQSRVLQENLVPQLLAPGASARGGPAG